MQKFILLLAILITTSALTWFNRASVSPHTDALIKNESLQVEGSLNTKNPDFVSPIEAAIGDTILTLSATDYLSLMVTQQENSEPMPVDSLIESLSNTDIDEDYINLLTELK